jgi:hypothetical protein
MKTVLAILLFGVLACSKSDLPQYTKLDQLRILAVVVSTPEIQNPGAGTTNVNVDPYISDIGGTGNITLTVQSCLDPGIAVGAAPSCTGALYASSVQTVSMTAPAGQPADTFGTPERTGKASSGSIAVGLQIPAGLLLPFPAALQNNGVAYLITVTATSGTASVRAYKRVLISNKTPNTNPAISDLLANGASLTTLPTGDATMSFTAGSTPETYVYLTTDGVSQTLTETFETTWFISDGEIENPRTKAGQTTTWTTPGAAPSGRQTVVVGVLRDGRGGTGVLIKKF